MQNIIQNEFAAKNFTMGQLNALVKILGGEENVHKILRNQVAVQLHPQPKKPILKIKKNGPVLSI